LSSVILSELGKNARTPPHVKSGLSHIRNNLLREETERLGVGEPDDDEIADTSFN